MADSVSGAQVANIGRRERRRRLLSGVVGMVAGVGLSVVVVAVGAPIWWRLGVVAPFLLASFGYFQAREKT